MVHTNSDANKTWHELLAYLPSLVTFERINFPQCPANVLHAVADKLPALQQLVAESLVEKAAEPLLV